MNKPEFYDRGLERHRHPTQDHPHPGPLPSRERGKPRDEVEVYFDLVGETDKAIKVSDGVSVLWLPKSQIRVEKRKDGVVVWMPEWLAKEKEII
jgi:hypothetical protein